MFTTVKDIKNDIRQMKATLKRIAEFQQMQSDENYRLAYIDNQKSLRNECLHYLQELKTEFRLYNTKVMVLEEFNCPSEFLSNEKKINALLQRLETALKNITLE